MLPTLGGATQVSTGIAARRSPDRFGAWRGWEMVGDGQRSAACTMPWVITPKTRSCNGRYAHQQRWPAGLAGMNVTFWVVLVSPSRPDSMLHANPTVPDTRSSARRSSR